MPPKHLRENKEWVAAMEKFLDGIDANDPPEILATLAVNVTAAALGMSPNGQDDPRRPENER